MPAIESCPSVPDLEPAFSPQQVADFENVSKNLILDEIHRGHLRAYRVGLLLRIPRQAILDWREAGAKRALEVSDLRDPCRHGKKPTGRPLGTGKSRKPRSRKAR